MAHLKSYSRGVSSLTAHLVLVTKYRKKVMNESVLSRLIEIVHVTCLKWNCEVIEVNGESDHIHLLFNFYPQMQLSKFINNLKTVTSRLIRKEFGEQVNSYYRNTAFWSESYFIASCGGVTLEKLKAYVQSQDSPQN